MTDNGPEIIILICDDEAEYRARNEGFVRSIIAEKFDFSTSPGIHVFNDGAGALDFLKQKESAAGVVLIADGNMKKIGEFNLARLLEKLNILPANYFICSNINHTTFSRVMSISGLDDMREQIGFLPKDFGKMAFKDALPKAIQKAGAEIGLKFPTRKEPRRSTSRKNELKK